MGKSRFYKEIPVSFCKEIGHSFVFWMFPKIGVFPPKWMGDNHGKTLIKTGWFGGKNPLFLENTHIAP